jgi:hypothetical protein
MSPGILVRDLATPLGTYAAGQDVEIVTDDGLGYVISIVSRRMRVARDFVRKGICQPRMCVHCHEPMPLARTSEQCIVCDRTDVQMRAQIMRRRAARLRAARST